MDAWQTQADYVADNLHPGDLKAAVTDGINGIIEPVREHFRQPEMAKLLKKVKSYRVTR